MEPTKNKNVQLLSTLVDTDDQEESEYRFLINGTHVKYVTVAPGILPKDDRAFAPAVLAGLPPFPPGDWNTGHIGHDSASGQPADLPGVKTIWHTTCIDHLETRKLERLRQNIHIVPHSLFDHPMVVKFTEFPWQTPYLETETTAYLWIEGCDIGPRFLGHLTEEGRVIGFVLEHINRARAVRPADLEACQSVLKRLHSLGVKQGDINKHNFLVRQDGRCVLLDFETAKKDASKVELEAEYQRLSESLQDPSLRGAVPAVALSEQMPS